MKPLTLILLLSIAAAAQFGDCSRAVYNAQCGNVRSQCVFNGSAGNGCDDAGGSCMNCYRGDDFIPAEGPNNAPVQPPPEVTQRLDQTHQFAGQFRDYPGAAQPRFIVTVPGPLERIGIQAGQCISRVNGRRLRAAFFGKGMPHVGGARLTFYSPGKANAVKRLRLR